MGRKYLHPPKSATGIVPSPMRTTSSSKCFRIRLQQLRFHAFHGVLPEEARLGQRFVLDLECAFHPPPEPWVDDLQRSVSYADLWEHIRELCVEQRFQLLESLADAIVERLRVDFPQLEFIRVCVRKPSVPLATILEEASVELSWCSERWPEPPAAT